MDEELADIFCGIEDSAVEQEASDLVADNSLETKKSCKMTWDIPKHRFI